jgi:hypothetical protein
MGAVTFFNSRSSGSNSGVSLKQVTKLSVKAPHQVNIDIENTVDFKRIPVEVLKLLSVEKNKIQTLADFNNADKTDFQKNNFTAFDGTMHLKTKYEKELEDYGQLGKNYMYSVDITKSLYKKITDSEVI